VPRGYRDLLAFFELDQNARRPEMSETGPFSVVRGGADEVRSSAPEASAIAIALGLWGYGLNLPSSANLERKMALEIPHGAEREYLIIFGVAAIYIATVPGRKQCIVGVTRDLGRSLAAMQTKWPHAEIIFAAWVKDRATATAIVAEIDGFVSVETARQEIEAVAANRQVLLTSHDVAMVRVRAAVARVKEKISEANATGGLAWFNSAYRAWRLEAQKPGQGMSYGEALVRLRRAVTKRLIEKDILALDSDLLPSIFPTASDRRKSLC
jgi:hypothetical protein